MRFEEALPLLTRNRPARAHRAAKRPERENEVREIENEGLLFHESEIKLLTTYSPCSKTYALKSQYGLILSVLCHWSRCE